MKKHICNTDNQYYKYALKKGMAISNVIPIGHCVFCGSESN